MYIGAMIGDAGGSNIEQANSGDTNTRDNNGEEKAPPTGELTATPTDDNDEPNIDWKVSAPATAEPESEATQHKPSSNPISELEDAKTPASDSAEGTPEPEVKPKKKRLTLQERLALAAKSKGKRPSIEATPSQELVTLVVSNEELKEEDQPKEDSELKPQQQPKPEVAAISEDTERIGQLQRELITKNNEVASANKKIRELEAKLAVVPLNQQWQDKLAAKDKQIEELMEEGRVLSKKELTLNETIKKLKLEVRDLDQALHEVRAKGDVNQEQMAGLDEVLRLHKFTDVSALLDQFAAQQITVAELQAEADNNSGWKAKHTALQKLYDQETAAHKQTAAQLASAQLDHDLERQELAAEIDQQNNQLQDVRSQLNQATQDKMLEISRLETKIEQLRLQLEHLDTKPSVDKSKFSTLQEQYDLAQENWRLVELRLIAKIDNLQSQVDGSAKAKAKVVGDFQRINVIVADHEQTIRQKDTSIDSLERKIQELELSLQVKNDEVIDTMRKVERLQQIHAHDHQDMEAKLKIAQEAARAPPLPVVNEELDIQREEEKGFDEPPSANSSYLSINDSFLVSPLVAAPLLDRRLLAALFDRRLLVLLGTIEEDAAATKNIQLVNKMAALIRRLEVEVNSLHDENTILANDKEKLLQQYLEILKGTQSTSDLEAKVNELEQAVAAMAAKENTMLEVIGEKTEQAEELKADIVDLKELCKLQVQQMIEMQERGMAK